MKTTKLLFWFTTMVLALTATVPAQFGNRDYDVTLNGQGMLRQAGFNDERVRYARVTLRRNGRADLQIEGDMPQTNFSGQWTSSGSDAVRVTLNSGFGNSNTYGNGTIYFRNNEVTRFEIDGRANGNRFTISFTAQNSGGGSDSGRPGGNAVVELVQNDLYDRIARDRRERIELEFDTADVYSISSRETGVRGTASLRVGSGNFEKIRYDATVDTYSNRINRSTWDYANNNDNRNNPPSGTFRAGRYTLQLVNTKRMIAVGNDNVTVQQVSANNSPSQQWDIESASGGYYYLRLANSSLVMTVEGKGDNGSSVIVAQQGRVGADNQLWEIRPGPDNGYYFISKVRGKALDSPSSARFEGGRMQVYSSNGEANQRFLLREIQVYDRGRDGRAGNRGGNRGNREGRAGVLNWRGRVDDTVELEVRGAAVYERVLSGKEISNARSNFTSPLPTRNVTVTVEKKRGRGRIEIVEQPSAANNWTAVIQIVDSSGGAGDYEFDLIWN